MIQVRNFYDNGKPRWDVRISAIVIGVLAIVLLSLVTGENGSSLIAWVLRK